MPSNASERDTSSKLALANWKAGFLSIIPRGTIDLLKSIFMHYFWVGVALTLLAIVLGQQVEKPGPIFATLVELLKTVGISVLVAAVFSFAASTSDLMERVSSLLQNIVVSRGFLNNIAESSKRDVLHAILKPSDQQKVIYGNIEDYYRHYIDLTMQVSSTNVRSNYISVCRASLNRENNLLQAEYRNYYRLYPSTTGYDDIEIGYYGEDHSRINHRSVTIYTPDGKTHVFGRDKILSLPQVEKDNSKIIRIPIEELGRGFDHLDIEFQTTQYGHDHWIVIGFQALLPTDGFRFHLECDEPLRIQEEETFVHGAAWHKDPKEVEGQSAMSLVCQQWIERGSGVSIVVSMPHSEIRQ